MEKREKAIESFRLDFDVDIYILRAQMRIYFLPNFLLFFQEDMWKLKCCLCHEN